MSAPDSNKVQEVTNAVADCKLENGEVKNGDAAGAEGGKGDGGPTFTEQFRAFSKFGDSKSDGKTITLSQSDKWMKQAKVIDGKTITSTDTGIHFKKLKSLKVSMADYNKFLDDLAKTKKVEVKDIKKKLTGCGAPGHTGSASGGSKSSVASTVQRLTDTSKYTGTHKQRFDDTGKGKGIAGRKDLPDSSGYVSGYQNKDSFDKKTES